MNRLKRQDVKDAYEDPSKRASEILRYLGLAGVAIIWMFRVEDDGVKTIPHQLSWPLFLIVSGLLLDFFQYAFLTCVYHWSFVRADRSVENISVPEWYAKVGWATWYLKIISVLVGYGFLIVYLSSKLFGGAELGLQPVETP